MYHNTTNETVKLAEYFDKVTKQDEKVMDFFTLNPGVEFTPPEVHKYVSSMAPLTSIRRAITNLTNAGKLVRSDVKRQGIYGRDNYTWKLRPHQMSLL